MSDSADQFIAIEIGGTKLQVVLGDGQGNIASRYRDAVDLSRGAEGIRESIYCGIKPFLEPGLAKAVGVGFGGPVDHKTGRVMVSHHVEGWAGFELGRWLREITSLPVAVDNDANVAALAEARVGGGVGFGRVFYITLGSGMGGGMVIAGLLYHGRSPGESEIGLVKLDKDGRTFESSCSGWGVDKKIRSYIKDNPQSIIAKLVAQSPDDKNGEISPGGEARYLSQAISAGDTGAAEILACTASDLAFGISHVTHLFNPEAVILGGGLSLLGEPLRSAVAGALGGFLAKAYRPGPIIKIASLGEDVVGAGALILARLAYRSQ